MRYRLTTGLLLLALLCSCATPPQSAALLQQAPAELPSSFLITDLPFFPQQDYQCGPAALATVLLASGVAVTPGQLVPQVYVPARKGSFQIEMTAAARSHSRVAYTLEPTLQALLQEVSAGHPVLVLQNLGLSVLPRWHFAVVKGFDLARNRVILNSGRMENREVSLAVFERTWARGDHWAEVVLPASVLPATAEPQAWFSALVALEQTGQTATASEGYMTGLQRWPDDQRLLMGAGNLHYAAGDSALALALFTRVAELYSDYAPAHNNLAQLQYEKGNVALALQHARRAVALGGEFAAVYQQTLDQLEQAEEPPQAPP
jgi:tetratricopeptide (TPR) repeat protein